MSSATKPPKQKPLGGRLRVDEYVAGITARDRTVLGRAITLVESNADQDLLLAQDLLVRIMPATGKAIRLGVTGVPGVGKSTFIEAFGTLLTAKGHRVAVLAVDPTSGLTGGSILGDKTRMPKLSRDDAAFIRPSPTSGSLGGVTRKTRESILICEAAGYDVILVETVGVGQSETMVADMVDFFLVLMLPGAGDELQGIKRGILELADLIAVNKADVNPEAARTAKSDYMGALRVMHGAGAEDIGWTVPVLMISAITGDGLEALWQKVSEHRAIMQQSGRFDEKRREQLRSWMWSMVDEHLLHALRTHPEVQRLVDALEADLLVGKITPTLGAQAILEAFGRSR